MIDGSQNKALIIVGNTARKNKQWLEYAEYCFDREQGLRKQAFVHLHKFLGSAENWTEIEKREFIIFLF